MTDKIVDCVRDYGPIAFTVVLGFIVNASAIWAMIALYGAIGLLPTIACVMGAGLVLQLVATGITMGFNNILPSFGVGEFTARA